jgi:enamine deaminase RidA (YjgF/YER057c/UK114 family)
MGIKYAFLESLLQAAKAPDVSAKAMDAPIPVAPSAPAATQGPSPTPPVEQDSDPAGAKTGLESCPTAPGTRSVPSTMDGPSSFLGIASKPVEWLWPGWIPLGKITIVSGEPDLGKSTLLLDLAARVSTSGVMPDNSQGSAGNVIIMSAQDAANDTIRPRLEAAGADLSRVVSLSQVVDEDQDRPVEVPTDLDHVEAVIAKYGARLVIIDPLPAFLAKDGAKSALYRLGTIAEKYRCAILCMLDRGRAILSQARAGLLVAQDPDDEEARILAVAKNSLAVKARSLKFKLEPAGAVCRVSWLGASLYLARQLAGPASSDEKKEAKAESKKKVEKAVDLLKDLLAYGPMTVRDCKKVAADAGFATRTVERAANQMGLIVAAQTDCLGGRLFKWKIAASENVGEMARCTQSLAQART